MKNNFISGSCYEFNYSLVIVIYLYSKENIGYYGLLNLCRHDKKGWTAPAFYSKDLYNIAWTEKELKEKFKLHECKQLDGRLRIEKIDDSSFVEYPIGQLEEIKI